MSSITKKLNSSDHDTLITLVGSMENLDRKFTEKFEDLKQDIKGINDGTITSIKDHEERIRVLESEAEDHALVKKVVYGAVALVLIAVFGSIVYLVINNHAPQTNLAPTSIQ